MTATLVRTLCIAAGLGVCLASAARAGGAWRTDRAWNDGRAEKCVYRATRTIYDVRREYVATAYTDKEHVDPRTTCKSESERGLEVFKHHWSERVPTERYDYDFSTMTYSRADDLALFKLTAATQDDCGASYKEIWRAGDELRWMDSVYFPGTGRREGTLGRDPKVQSFEALTLTLRDFDFDAPKDRALQVIPSQKDTHQVAFTPQPRTVRHAGRTTLDLPIGKTDAHALELVGTQGQVEARYWFAADGSAPFLHALVQYEGPQGVTYRLESLERTAYWKR